MNHTYQNEQRNTIPKMNCTINFMEDLGVFYINEGGINKPRYKEFKTGLHCEGSKSIFMVLGIIALEVSASERKVQDLILEAMTFAEKSESSSKNIQIIKKYQENVQSLFSNQKFAILKQFPDLSEIANKLNLIFNEDITYFSEILFQIARSIIIFQLSKETTLTPIPSLSFDDFPWSFDQFSQIILLAVSKFLFTNLIFHKVTCFGSKDPEICKISVDAKDFHIVKRIGCDNTYQLFATKPLNLKLASNQEALIVQVPGSNNNPSLLLVNGLSSNQIAADYATQPKLKKQCIMCSQEFAPEEIYEGPKCGHGICIHCLSQEPDEEECMCKSPFKLAPYEADARKGQRLCSLCHQLIQKEYIYENPYCPHNYCYYCLKDIGFFREECFLNICSERININKIKKFTFRIEKENCCDKDSIMSTENLYIGQKGGHIVCVSCAKTGKCQKCMKNYLSEELFINQLCKHVLCWNCLQNEKCLSCIVGSCTKKFDSQGLWVFKKRMANVDNNPHKDIPCKSCKLHKIAQRIYIGPECGHPICSDCLEYQNCCPRCSEPFEHLLDIPVKFTGENERIQNANSLVKNQNLLDKYRQFGEESKISEKTDIYINFKRTKENNKILECELCKQSTYRDLTYRCFVCPNLEICSTCFEKKIEKKTHKKDHLTYIAYSPFKNIRDTLSNISGTIKEITNHFKSIQFPYLTCSECKKNPSGPWLKCDDLHDSGLRYYLCIHCLEKRNYVPPIEHRNHSLFVMLMPRRISLNTLEFKIKRKLGEGCFGKVHLAKIKNLNDYIAMKTVRETYRNSVEREILAYEELGNRYILGFIGDGEIEEGNSRRVAILMEYMPNGTLQEVIQTKASYSNRRKFQWMLEVIRALRRIHSKSFIHLDIKPDNILLDSNFSAKVGDMGVSVYLGLKQSIKEVKFPIQYAAPELLQAKDELQVVEKILQAEGSVDVFSYGLLFNQIFTYEMHQRTKNHDVEFTKRSKYFWNVIEACTRFVSKKRPTAAEVEDILSSIETRYWNFIKLKNLDIEQYSQYSEEEKDELFKEFYGFCKVESLTRGL